MGKKGGNKKKLNNRVQPVTEESIPPSECEMVERDLANECEIVEPVPGSDPDILEYIQPENSQYEGRMVTVLIGSSEKRYTIPECLLDQAPALKSSLQVDECSDSWYTERVESPKFALIDVDEDIGHTLIHYLYTGDYQTLQRLDSTDDVPKRTTEYTRSVLAYRTAVTYEISGLKKHAKKYMRLFDKYVSTLEVITLARKVFPRITENAWYSGYVTARIMADFKEDEGIFERDEYSKSFGEAPEFDKFLWKIMAQAYSSKISAMRNELASKSVECIDSDSPVTQHETMEEEDGVVDKQRDGASIFLADVINYEGQCSSLEPEPNLDIVQQEGFSEEVLPPDTDSWTGLEPKPYSDHPSSGYDLAKDAECKNSEASSWGTAVTPHSDVQETIGKSIAPSVQFHPGVWADLDSPGCPDWEIHSMKEDLLKDCKDCQKYGRRMFLRFVDFSKVLERAQGE